LNSVASSLILAKGVSCTESVDIETAGVDMETLGADISGYVGPVGF